MPRKTRTIRSGEYYHIVSRGNNHQWLFETEDDFKFYLRMLERYSQKYNVQILHYCLMNNHTHLLLKSNVMDHGITKLMHDVQMIYAFYYQRKYGKSGHVFEDRFKDFHISSESYLLECGRYIERNPVRAMLAKKPEGYDWSSYRFYGYGRLNNLITENPLYSQFGGTSKERQKAYRQYLTEARPYDVIVDAHIKERVLF